MSTLLQIKASIFSGDGQSSQLADRFVRQWQARHPAGRLITRDLAADPVPHLDAARFRAFGTDADDRTPEQQAHVAYSDQLIGELQQADALVIGLPMYNFGIPSQLKAYFDHVARAGVTFRYTPNGPQGLLSGTQVTILAARGGRYEGTPKDTQSRYVRDFLNFIGLTDISFIYAEGLAMGDQQRAAALDGAAEHIEQLAA